MGNKLLEQYAREATSFRWTIKIIKVSTNLPVSSFFFETREAMRKHSKRFAYKSGDQFKIVKGKTFFFTENYTLFLKL